MVYKRPCASVLLERMREPRQFIQAIAGPRQVGKTTLVLQVLEECGLPYTFETADGIATDSADWIAETWETVRSRLQFAHEKEHVLVFDEIHKISRWSEYVKREWDADTRNGVNIKLVILGSSRLLLKAGLEESLTGRFELIRMTHWSWAEMHDAFGWSLEQYIYFGGYPGSARLIGDERRWRRYMNDSICAPSIEKDVLLTTIVYKPALMRQLFDLGCAYSGEEISLNKILGQLQDAGNVSTLANYLNTLGESNLLCGLHKYAHDAARKYNSIPKMMVYNPALLTVRAGKGFEQEATTPRRWGRWVETAVGAHLLCNAAEGDYHVYYWRENNDEVDFVVQRGEDVVAIEVKSGHRTYNSGLAAFRSRFSPMRSLIVGSGGMPLDEFLRLNPERLFDID